MFFIENADGQKVATATAFYEPRDLSNAGWLHWVAVRRDFQGNGLARPLISHTLNRLLELGYKTIKIPTQTKLLGWRQRFILILDLSLFLKML